MDSSPCIRGANKEPPESIWLDYSKNGGKIKASACKKEHIQRQQQEKAEEIERERKWEEQKRRAEEERQKLERLMKDAENWNKSRRIREYLSAVEEMGSTGNCPLKFDDGLENWMEWAKLQADRLDPFSPNYKPPASSKENPDGEADKSKTLFAPWLKSFGSP